jgi:hypothetical protein
MLTTLEGILRRTIIGKRVSVTAPDENGEPSLIKGTIKDLTWERRITDGTEDCTIEIEVSIGKSVTVKLSGDTTIDIEK